MSSNLSVKSFTSVAVLLMAMTVGQASIAQTIAEYSEAQRAALMADLEKSRKVSAGAATPASSAPAAVVPPVVVQIQKPAPFERRVSVNGVFVVRERTTTEVTVDGRAHLVEIGQQVPGTPWRIDSADASSVVMSKAGGAGAGGVGGAGSAGAARRAGQGQHANAAPAPRTGRRVAIAKPPTGSSTGAVGGASQDRADSVRANRESRTFYLQGIRQRIGA
mgnify:CR=1 FL=1